jgi:hypothetical protein
MTTTQQTGNPVTRWATTVIGAIRKLNDELLGAHEVMARPGRFPQPRPQADLAQAQQVHPASSTKVLTGA